MRLLFLGDRIVGGSSAYSKVGYETCTRLPKLGHQVAHIPMGKANRMGNQNFQNVLIYTSGNDPFGEDVAVQHYTDFKADMIVSIKENWVFNRLFKEAVNYVPMCPIDHSPVSPAITGRLDHAFKVISISRHGQMELKRKGIDSYYIPHGVRLDLYKPPTPEEKKQYRKAFFLDPDAFTVGIVAMNRSRKMIARMLRGYKRFIENNPDVKTQMMLWTNTQPRQPIGDITVGVSDVGVNLLPEMVELKLTETVHWPKWEQIQKLGGLPEWDPSGGWDMVKLYSTFDVLLLCSGGEGFGLPLIEAQAVGCPVITTNYAGGPEQVGAGLTVPWDDYVIIATPGVRYVLVNIEKMAEALVKIYNTNREKLGRKARRFAERYSWENIIQLYWEPFLLQCSEELYPLYTKDGVKSWA